MSPSSSLSESFPDLISFFPASLAVYIILVGVRASGLVKYDRIVSITV